MINLISPAAGCFFMRKILLLTAILQTANAFGLSMSASAPSLKNLLRSGLDAPPIGIGLAALGRPGYITLTHSSDFPQGKSVEDMRERAYEVLDAAWDRGVRYYDAARSYGLAEEFLSGWIKKKGIAPGDIVVGSKWGYTYTADWKVDTDGAPHEIKEHTAENLIKQTSETESYLGEHLNLYQIHSATQGSGVLTNQAVIDQLWQIKKTKGWKIGLSLSGVEQGETLMIALGIKNGQGDLLFDSVQATYNVLECSSGPALTEASKDGLQVIVKEGMANGRVFKSGNTGPSSSRLSTLHTEAEAIGCTVDALALACIIVQPFSPMVLSGAACIEHMGSNADACGLVADGKVTLDLSCKILEATKMEPKEYWDERGALAWK